MIAVDRHVAIGDVPAGAWDAFAARDRVALEREHLEAIEAARVNGLHPYYLVARDGKRAVGIAHAFAIDLDLGRLGSDVPDGHLEAVRSWYPRFMRYRVVECGLISGIGMAIAGEHDREAALVAAVAGELDAIASHEGAEIVLVRDVEGERAVATREAWGAAGYRPALGFPVARMALRWPSFDAWLAALSSDKRHNIRKKMRRLASPDVEVRTVSDYASHASRMADLWSRVAVRRSDYEHERLDERYFAEMARCLRGRSHMLGIFVRGELAAFALSLLGDAEYFWAYVGIDYELRDAYDLYFNLAIEGIRAAFAAGKTSLNLGVTTYEWKTFLGCELEPMAYFVKHTQGARATAAIVELVRSGITQPENHHRVFRDDDVSARRQPKELERRLAPPERDVLARVRNQPRADVLRTIGMYAYRPAFEGAQEPVIRHRGRDVIMLGTNSYLGLATHPETRAAAAAAIERYGTGCSGSPLLNGTLEIHEQLARSLADFTGKGDALLFSTGYQTNLGILAGILTRDDVVVMDERNHASLVDAARLSQATWLRYRHNDMASLESVLAGAPKRPTLIVSDSLFSMEGTVVDVRELVRVARRHGARLMLDESHALGVVGPNGCGVAEQAGVLADVDLVMGTFSKSFAAQGGFVAGDADVIDGLRHASRPYIFSASLAPSTVATVQAALAIVRREPERRERLLANARFLADGLRALGYEASWHGGAIVPIHCGSEMLAVALFHKLFEEGVFVNPVLHPAVPKGGELLRTSVMATCGLPLLERALDVFARVRTTTFPPR